MLVFFGALHLMNDLQKKSFILDDDGQHRIVRALLKLLEDTNYEVQDLVFKCLKQLIGQLNQQNIEMIYDQLPSNTWEDIEQLVEDFYLLFHLH